MLPEDVEKGGHKLIRLLPPERIEEINAMLRKGEKIAQIARVIQQDWKLLPEAKIPGLEKAIIRWRDAVANASVMTKLMTTGAVDSQTKLAVKVDALNEMSLLYAMQKTRIEKLFEREHVGPMLLDQLGKEITRGNAMLKTIADMQFEVGVTPRVPKTTNLKQNQDGSFTITENPEDLKLIEAARKEIDAWVA